MNNAKKILLIFVTLIILLIVWGICSIIMSFMKINKIIIDGEVKYTESQITEVCEIEVGMRVNDIDTDDIEKRLIEGLTYISKVKVKCSFFGNIKIYITEDVAKYYTQISEGYFCLSSDFRLLEMSTDKQKFSDLMYIELPAVKSAIVGNMVSYYDETSGELVRLFVSDLNNSILNNKIISVDASEKYNLSVSCIDYDVIFGAYKDIETKLGYVELMEKDSVVKEREGVIFDVSNTESATIKFKK